jgi:hypothetical protein
MMMMNIPAGADRGARQARRAHRLNRRGVCSSMAMLAVALAVVLQSGQVRAQAIDCSQVQRAVEDKGNRKITAISRDEAATAEAVDAAKKCLANIARAINAISIPSVAFSVDFSGIVGGMVNRACQVVTTQIDGAGRVVNGTVSGAANRVIGDVNSAIGLPPGTGTPVSGTVGSMATPGFVGTPMGGTVALPPATQPGLFDRMACTLRGNCP